MYVFLFTQVLALCNATGLQVTVVEWIAKWGWEEQASNRIDFTIAWDRVGVGGAGEYRKQSISIALVWGLEEQASVCRLGLKSPREEIRFFTSVV